MMLALALPLKTVSVLPKPYVTWSTTVVRRK
jgi:hypothetical protein